MSDACGFVVPNVPVVEPPGNPNFANRRVVFHATTARTPAAWEVMQADGHFGGKFTAALLACLRAPRVTPLTARDLNIALKTALGRTFTFDPTPYEAD